MKNITIAIDGTSKPITPADPKEGYSLKEAQSFVGGMVEIVRLGNGMIMLVNEEGLLMGLPLNPMASCIAGQPIVGPVAIIADEEIG